MYQPLKDVYLMPRYNGKERRQMYDINLSLNHLFKTDFFLPSLNFVLPRKKRTPDHRLHRPVRWPFLHSGQGG